MRKCFFYFLALFLFIIIFFLTSEGILSILQIGYNTQPFERNPWLSGYYQDNQLFPNKYYPSQNISTLSGRFLHLFPIRKESNTLRIFVLGGSTAQGFPYSPNHSFSKIIEKALLETGLYENVEVINLGMSALSSYYIADVAPKLLQYEPDALIIYAGQNEYYGTITSLQKPYWMQKLYLRLKEWRTFQLLFSFVETKKRNTNESLMAQQFAQKRIPPNLSLDRKIARDFIRNIESVVKLYSKKHIPVFMFEPVCNLIDMPPFSSQNEEALVPFLKPYSHLFTNTRRLAVTLSQKGVLEVLRNNFPSNAHVLYLQGLANMQSNIPFLDILETAKDYDTTPFRYRSELRKALHQFVKEEASNPYFFFLPLREEIIQRYGIQAFDNSLFIDHLHFNRKGQHLLAHVFCNSWLSSQKTKDEALARVTRFFSNPQEVEKSIFYHPYYDYEAEGRVAGLLEDPPYSLMILPYTFHIDLSRHPFVLSTPPHILHSILKTNDFLKVYFSYLYQKNNREEMAFLINAIRQIAPAHPQSYYNIAIFLSTTNHYSEDAANAWIVAILLSGKTNTNILSSAFRYFSYHHKEDILKQWRIKP